MAWTPQYQQQPQQQAQQPQQGQPQYQNPAAGWQQTYQNSQWARPMPQQMPQQGYQQQYQPQYQQNPYQRQMPQQQMPQFSQQQINSFLNYMQSRPMPNFMADPRYQAQHAEKPVYQPPVQTARTYVPKVTFSAPMNIMGGRIGGGGFTVGDDAADAWVKARAKPGSPTFSGKEREQSIRDLYAQYYAGAA